LTAPYLPYGGCRDHGDSRHTPLAKREVRKLRPKPHTLAEKYRELKRSKPGKPDSWYAQQTAKMDITPQRDSETIRKNMKVAGGIFRPIAPESLYFPASKSSPPIVPSKIIKEISNQAILRITFGVGRCGIASPNRHRTLHSTIH
jgi:hypothetical protein